MGNWHCVPSSCAEVVYQEYLPPTIRWRYGNEAWQEIQGALNYSTQVITPNFTGGQSPNVIYNVKVTGSTIYDEQPSNQTYTPVNSDYRGPIRNISVVYTGIYPNLIVYVRVAASNTK
ncbi:MAG: hypothetical protein RLZZ535_100 [Cyanobacteriota bacterium]|jgi:hypothetical protein